MKTRLIPYKLDNDEIIYAEVIDSTGRFVDASASSEKDAVKFLDRVDTLNKAVSEVIKKLKKMSPDELQVKFGVKMAGKAGWIFAAGSAEGNLEITLSWKNEEGLDE